MAVMRVAIIGAGVAGLACAERLDSLGATTQLFDKGKRPGGRLSTLILDDFAWDFGAQYFTVRDPRFADRVSRWETAGHVARWTDGPDGAWIGAPTMASFLAASCADRDVRFGALVQAVHPVEGGWQLSGPGWEESPFDAVVIAVPAEQAATLIGLHDLGMAREAAMVRSAPCWTLMAAFPEPLPGAPDVLRSAGAISWAARNESKPGRPSAECWVIQAGGEWSARNLERDQEGVAQDLLVHLAELIGAPLPEPIFLKAHRWRFAMPQGGNGAPLWNADLKLGACGDWCMAARIEDAWLSGHELADRVVETLGVTAAPVKTAEVA